MPVKYREELRPGSQRVNSAVLIDVAEQERHIFLCPFVHHGKVHTIDPRVIRGFPQLPGKSL